MTTLQDLKAGDTVTLERQGETVTGIVEVDGDALYVQTANSEIRVSRLYISNAIKYGWKLCNI